MHNHPSQPGQFRRLVTACFSALGLAAAPQACAGLDDGQLEAGRADEWVFSVAPALWFAAIDGSVAVRGFEAQVDGQIGDIPDAWKFGATGRFQAAKGPWSIALDLSYLEVDEDGDTIFPTVTDVDDNIEALVLEVGGAYRFYETSIGDHPYRWWSLAALGGVRYTDIDVDPDVSGVPPFAIESGSEDWVDGFVGIETNLQWTRRLRSQLRADIGGFGAQSNLTWQIQYYERIALTDSLDLLLGYRHLKYEYEDGELFDEFEFDAALSGPVVGIDYVF